MKAGILFIILSLSLFLFGSVAGILFLQLLSPFFFCAGYVRLSIDRWMKKNVEVKTV